MYTFSDYLVFIYSSSSQKLFRHLASNSEGIPERLLREALRGPLSVEENIVPPSVRMVFNFLEGRGLVRREVRIRGRSSEAFWMIRPLKVLELRDSLENEGT